MIQFHNQNIAFSLLQKRKVTHWIKDIISEYNYSAGELNFVFCNDEYILQLNQKFLNHDYYTDIITFNDNLDEIVNGDIYISIDRVKENSLLFSVTFNEELKRVIIHGILHLLGFSDETDDLKKKMRNLENKALQKVKELIII
jgi:probable rRNA maturation factor